MTTVDFTLIINNNEYSVSPDYNDETKVIGKRSDSYILLEKSFSGDLYFSRSDFDLIDGFGDFQRFNLRIIKTSAGLTKQYYLKFHKYDCEINYDTHVLSVSPTIISDESQLIESLTNEIAVGNLALNYKDLVYTENALLQVYLVGSQYVDNYMGGAHWQTKIEPIEDFLILGSYGFGYSFGGKAVIPADETIPFSGIYLADTPWSSYWYKEGGGATLIYETSNNYWELIYNGGEQTFRGAVGEDVFNGYALSTGVELVDITDSTRKVHIYKAGPVARILTNVDEIDGTATTDISDADIISDNRGFTKYHKLTELDYTLSFDTSTIGKYGGFYDGSLYFSGDNFGKPSSTYQIKTLGINNWLGCSAWVSFDNELSNKIGEGSLSIDAPSSAVKLSELINLMASYATDGAITHDETCSQFLYNEINPISGETNGTLAVVQKTSILFDEIEEGGKLNTLLLDDLFTALKSMRLLWHIEDNKLYIEHELYYYNGGSYGVENTLIDLTTYKEPTTLQNWDYYTSNVKYDTNDIKHKKTWSCSEPTSDVFGVITVESNDSTLDKSNVEDVVFNNFYFDLLYAIAFPQKLTEDGFIMLECDVNNDTYTVKSREVDGVNIQNGLFTKLYLSNNFFNFVLPFDSNIIADEVRDTDSIKRIKEIEINFSARIPNFSGKELINTKLGTGEITSWTEYLSNDRIEATVRL